MEILVQKDYLDALINLACETDELIVELEDYDPRAGQALRARFARWFEVIDRHAEEREGACGTWN
ncbi:hypothetical protein Aaci_1084 [Alicyclobacillus acidocaldarius subsp. acidocaldarius DSM 446]|uniref:Uncharacterized protein n=1 Tax=Alicyclobacillus acidocaldarius subsp. acidocaldarius (strain ATCC 27009 / DSM 446 / BCRC 14685 / JCM 5260 / KCTC 1825 / NBRC 15652 / NCIMB 11725 / NRRL B-14509 / 104-IA) TaxID=521098 RepID=C8WVJ8_ALIAD|nr:hypothetical protein Aaci_1084 [Alicyclobacillus acidocaldarius subsp. acidocaldarius DSM 446]